MTLDGAVPLGDDETLSVAASLGPNELEAALAPVADDAAAAEAPGVDYDEDSYSEEAEAAPAEAPESTGAKTKEEPPAQPAPAPEKTSEPEEKKEAETPTPAASPEKVDVQKDPMQEGKESQDKPAQVEAAAAEEKLQPAEEKPVPAEKTTAVPEIPPSEEKTAKDASAAPTSVEEKAAEETTNGDGEVEDKDDFEL